MIDALQFKAIAIYSLKIFLVVLAFDFVVEVGYKIFWSDPVNADLAQWISGEFSLRRILTLTIISGVVGVYQVLYKKK